MDSTSSKPHPEVGRFPLTRILPMIAFVAFLAMITIGEMQIRASPKWPPPARHEIGGREIDNPPILDLAIALNLPASGLVVLMSVFSDGFTYAIDDHQLIVYLPWSVLVYCLWYFVAYRLDRNNRRLLRERAFSSHLVLCIQWIVMFEALCAVAAIATTYPGGINEGKDDVFVFIGLAAGINSGLG